MRVPLHRTARAAGLVLLLAAALPASALAQERGRFAVGFGGGAGSATANCVDCGGGRETGRSGYFTVGIAPSDRVLIGLGANLWTKSFTESSLDARAGLTMYSVTGTLTVYPTASRFFVKGGVGAGFIDAEVRVGDTRISSELGQGLGLLAGAGYDIGITRRISITPAVNVWYGRPGELRIQGETLARDWSQNVVDFTIGLTIR